MAKKTKLRLKRSVLYKFAIFLIVVFIELSLVSVYMSYAPASNSNNAEKRQV